MKAPYTDAESEQSSMDYPCSFSAAAGRPTVAIIDLSILASNYAEVVKRAGSRNILAVVKAGAYGHGAVQVSRKLVSLGVSMLGVALVEEGGELREAGISAPILVMGPVFPEQALDIVGLDLTPVVFSLPLAQALSAAALNNGKRAKVHIKIDTGMGRIGLSPEAAVAFILEISRLPGIVVEGLMTHFADADLRDKQFAAFQMDRFEGLIRTLEARGVNIPIRHAANSAAVLGYDRALLTMVRPGIMLYGYNPLESGLNEGIAPVMSLTTRIAFLKKVSAGTSISYGRTFVTRRESIIATVPLGYADGYIRSLSNRGEMLVRGRRAPVVGRVCMDMTMLDVTDVPGVSEGDEVTVIGRQGNEYITADDIARAAGTIAYEVLCGISSRVPRVFR